MAVPFGFAVPFNVAPVCVIALATPVTTSGDAAGAPMTRTPPLSARLVPPPVAIVTVIAPPEVCSDTLYAAFGTRPVIRWSVVLAGTE